MPALISAADFRGRFEIAPEIRDSRITPHIGSASRRLRKWVGDALYTQASDVTNNDSVDEDLVADLKSAEAHLAFHFAIFGMNTPLTSKGVLATSVAGEGKEIRRYLTPKETAELSGYYLELAREIAEPYMISDGSPAAPFESIGLDQDAEASTRMYGASRC